jgi:hypothetical protein
MLVFKNVETFPPQKKSVVLAKNLEKFMSRFLTVCCLVMLLVSSSFAQDKKQPPKDDFELQEMPEDEVHPYFAVGGGFNAMLQMPDFSNINSMIQPLGISALDKNLVSTGGLGFVSLPFVNHMRIGGGGGSAKSTQCQNVIDTINGTLTSLKRTAEFSLNYGGLTVEYVVPLTFTQNKVVIVGGLLLGLGTIGLELDQTTSDPRTYNNFYDPSSTLNFVRQIHASYVAYQPYVNIEYSIFPFLMIRAGVGYNGTAVGTWYVDRTIDISGVPSITGNSISFNGGVFLGIFR